MPNDATHVSENFDGESPAGSSRDGYVTYHETDEYLIDAIKSMIASKEGQKQWRLVLPGKPEITVHHCWSGYSEYTITSSWDEITVTWGKYSYDFKHVSEFFRALADA